MGSLSQALPHTSRRKEASCPEWPAGCRKEAGPLRQPVGCRRGVYLPGLPEVRRTGACPQVQPGGHRMAWGVLGEVVLRRAGGQGGLTA